MRKENIMSITIMVLLTLFLCSSAYAVTAMATDNEDAVAASVGGFLITESHIIRALPETTPRILANKQVALDGLIAQHLLVGQAAVQKSSETAGTDQDNKTLVQAYIKKVAESLPKPTTSEIKTYYDAHPELFSQRAVYTLQEIAISADKDQLESVLAKYLEVKTLKDMVDWLESNNIRYVPSANSVGAEAVPADLLTVLPKLKRNEVITVARTGGLSIIQLVDKTILPKTLHEVSPDIEKFLFNQALANTLQMETERLASSINIEYFPPYQSPR